MLEPAEKKRIISVAEQVFLDCEPVGVYGRFSIEQDGSAIVFPDHGITWQSSRLSALLEGAGELFLFAVTVGPDVVAKRDALMAAGDSWRAVIYDAAASEIVDAAADWVNQYLGKLVLREGLRLTKNRFSPGYGDLALSVQADFSGMLELDKVGISLNDSFLMLPEKSVTAVAGILEM